MGGGFEMTSQALNIADQIQTLTELEVDYLWDILKRRRDEALLRIVDVKLEESEKSLTLSDEEAANRLARLDLS